MRTANTKLFRTRCLALLLTLGLTLTLTMKSSRASAAGAKLNAQRQLSFDERVTYQRAIEAAGVRAVAENKAAILAAVRNFSAARLPV